MEQLEYTICVKVKYFQKTRQIVFSYIFFKSWKIFFWLAALQSQPMRSIQNSNIYIFKSWKFLKNTAPLAGNSMVPPKVHFIHIIFLLYFVMDRII